MDVDNAKMKRSLLATNLKLENTFANISSLLNASVIIRANSDDRSMQSKCWERLPISSW